MSFLSAAFLWGLPLLAVPVAIHLLSRRRQEVVKWGAMQFLLDSSIRRRKIWRLDDLILMLLRTLAVLGIVLALSRPIWLGAGMIGGSGRDVIFVWDVSLSMEREYQSGRTSFESLLEKTNELMGQLGTGDTVRGLVTIGRGRWLTSESQPATDDQKQHLILELQKVGVTQASADWLTCLGTALRVAPPRSAKSRLIVVLSDGQAQGWRQKDQSAWQNIERLTEGSKIPTVIELYNVIGVMASTHNLAVDKLTTARQLLGVGENYLAEAEIRNHGPTPVQFATIDWSLDNVALGQLHVGPIGPGETTQLRFKLTTSQPGVSRLKCHLELRDDLKSDNDQILIVETIENVPLLLVDDSAENDPLKSDKGYLLAALGQDPGKDNPSKASGIFRVTTITSRELSSQSLSKFRTVVFTNTPDIDEVALSKLTDFVRQGGGLWVSLGDRTRPNEFNQKFYRSGSGLSPWPIDNSVGDLERREEFVTIHPPDRDHPATVLLNDTQRLDIDRVKVFQRFPFAVAPARIKVPVLLQSGAGDALAIEGFSGRGRVIVQSLPLGVRWSNLPLTQAFVPLVHEWLWYLVQPTAIQRNLLPGDPLQVSLPENEHVREVQLNRPNGSPLNLSNFKRGDQLMAQSRETLVPGQYEVVVRIEGKEAEIQPYQVMRDAEESNLDQWSQELIAKWNGMPGIRLNPSSSLAMPTGTKAQNHGDPLWSTLLSLVLLAFVVELWLVRLIAGKRFAGRGDSPDRRPFTDVILGRIRSVRGHH